MSNYHPDTTEKMELSLSQLAAVLGVDLIGEDRIFTRVSINTRTLESGDLFVAIKGENFDAHDYLQQAEEKGACGLVVEQVSSSVLPQIQVEDTRVALGDIASLWSSAFTLPIVAITGSCGKTTVKEMTAAILGHGFKSKHHGDYEHILATRGNLNNDIGVPLTLLRLKKTHEAAVIELGANHIGEIKQLVAMVQPNVAVITNVAHAHIEGFGSIEGVARAKSEIYSGLQCGGTAVINADDAFADYWRAQCQELNKNCNRKDSEIIERRKNINQLTFGLDNPADVSAEYKQLTDGIELTITTPVGKQSVKLHQFGRHNVYNALAATTAAISAGCSLDDVKKGLESFTNVSGRLEQKAGLQGAIIFDDTYNANPGSVRAGIEAIQQIAGDAVLILGDMGELGEQSTQLHYQLGVDAANMGIQQLYTIGNLSQEICNGFLETKKNSTDMKTHDEADIAIHFTDQEALIQCVKNKLNKNSVVLVKGSRSMKMESVVTALLENTGLEDPGIEQNKTEGA